MNEKRQTDVTVEVLNLTDISKAALDYANGRLPEGVSKWNKMAPGTYCRATDSEGRVYAFDDQGVGPENPIRNETGETALNLRFRASREEEGRIAFSASATCEISLNLSEVLALPVERECNLAEFIRTFGSRLERNYGNWNRVLLGTE